MFGRATGAARRCPPLEAPTGHWRQAGLLVAVERHSPMCDVPCPGHLCTECGCDNGVGRHTGRLPQRLARAASRRTARRLRACLGSLLAGGGWPASRLAEGRWCDGACDQPEAGGVGRLDGSALTPRRGVPTASTSSGNAKRWPRASLVRRSFEPASYQGQAGRSRATACHESRVGVVIGGQTGRKTERP